MNTDSYSNRVMDLMAYMTFPGPTTPARTREQARSPQLLSSPCPNSDLDTAILPHIFHPGPRE